MANKDIVVPEPLEVLRAEKQGAQAVPLPGTRRPGYSAVYRHVKHTEGLLERPHPSINTVFDTFEVGWQRNPAGKCFGHREYDAKAKLWSEYMWETYDQIRQRRDHFGAGLMHLHKQHVMNGKSRQFGVAVWMNNCPEWQLTDLACQRQALFSVALYDTLGPETSQYIMDLCEVSVVVTTIDHIPTLLNLKAKLANLKIIISVDPLDAGELPGRNKKSLLNSWANQVGIIVTAFGDVEKVGQQHPCTHGSPKADDILTICFTSGTTGFPKGAILTHSNAVSSIAANGYLVPDGEDDVVFSYLPLAHIYGRIVEVTATYLGRAIGYYHGNMLELLDDIQKLQPTIFPSVPRILNRIVASIRAQTINAPGIAGVISRKAFAAKLANMENGYGVHHMLWDRIWCRKIRMALGGRVRYIVNGAAPIGREAMQFLRVAFACDVVEGYGMTENFAQTHVSWVDDNQITGFLGGGVASTEYCLKDVKELNYTSDDKPNPRGELLIRGSNVFKGFYKAPERTKEVFEDGWFMTGDVGEIDSLGRLRLIDRVKNFFKLAQGEYIAPEKIENIYAASDLLAQIFVHGDSHETYLVAVIGVDPVAFPPWASKILGEKVTDGIGSIEAAGRQAAVKGALLKELDRVSVGRLQGFEKVKNLHITLEPFTLENALTPTLKIKRNVALKMFRSQIDQLYASKPAGTSPEFISKL